MGGAALEGLVDDPEDAVALFEAGTGGLARARATTARPSARWPAWSRRACGCSCSRTPPTGAPHPLLAQRGARQGAALRRLLPRRADPAALDGRRARPAAAGAAVARRPEPGRRHRRSSTQMLQMGDEAHNRNRAGTLMLLRDLAPAMVASGADAADVAEALRFVGGNDHFFLNLAMPACKLALDAARDIDGLDDGRRDGPQRHRLRHPGRPAPATSGSPARPRSPTGSTSATTAPTTPTPTSATRRSPRPPGIGGFAMATAPAIVRLRRRLGARRAGHHPPDARDHPRREPALDRCRCWSSQGVPTGIDVTRVCRTGDPAPDQHRHGRPRGRRRSGRRRAGHPAAEIFPAALARLGRAHPRSGRPPERRLMSTLPEGRSGVPSSR